MVGTHVAGSVLGNGKSSLANGGSGSNEYNTIIKGIVIKGIAYESKLLFQAIEQFMDWTEEGILYFHSSRGIQPPESGLFGIPENLKTTLFQYAYVYLLLLLLLFIILDKVKNKNNMQIYINNNIGFNKEK